jgi:hypothetical protein
MKPKLLTAALLFTLCPVFSITDANADNKYAERVMFSNVAL